MMRMGDWDGEGWGLDYLFPHVTPPTTSYGSKHHLHSQSRKDNIESNISSHIIIFSIPTSPLLSISRITYFELSSPRFCTPSHFISHPNPISPLLVIRLIERKSIRVKTYCVVVSSPSRSLSLDRPQRLRPTTVPYSAFRLLTRSSPTSLPRVQARYRALANDQDQTINRLLRAQTSKSRSKLDAPAENEASPVPPGATGTGAVGPSGPAGDGDVEGGGGEGVDSGTRGKRKREMPLNEDMIRFVSKLNGEGGLVQLVGVVEGKEGWIAV